MSFVKYEPQGSIAYLIIDREKALNALNTQVLSDLDAAIDAIDLDAVRCVIVRGAGEKSFVAGADIAQMKELSKEEGVAFGKQGNDVMRKLESLPIPTIAAVGGYALGGGCELAMSCDFRICSDTAVFGQPETGRGITPGVGGTQRSTPPATSRRTKRCASALSTPSTRSRSFTPRRRSSLLRSPPTRPSRCARPRRPSTRAFRSTSTALS